MMKLLLSLVLAFAFCDNVSAQTFAETLRYLNDKLNSEASYSTQSQGQKNVWTVSADGRLITKLMHRDGYALMTKSYYLKSLCNHLTCSSLTTTPDLMQVNDGRPGTLLIITTAVGQKLLIDVVDEEAGNRIRNAIFHLVTLAKSNKSYKAKDPFDY